MSNMTKNDAEAVIALRAAGNALLLAAIKLESSKLWPGELNEMVGYARKTISSVAELNPHAD